MSVCVCVHVLPMLYSVMHAASIACVHVCMYVCMPSYVCMPMYVCMYVCMYVEFRFNDT